ncbi:basic membrane protein A [Candidatus Caldarchaeum subterraneum]|uniref:Basic membrane protein A n=2 Tax=Caldiarchaeum subterraneum TaxID=311458 RepID=E6N6K0_CALS0|nr:basic membrane protein A [Candidatus Caldarchaeum subterraneum]BAJ50734.1 basic membrane protein A [Candidatus Caldarchaeum subterraneum]GBC72278.1 Membrane lipoprotein TmpC [archaeon HR03]
MNRKALTRTESILAVLLVVAIVAGAVGWTQPGQRTVETVTTTVTVGGSAQTITITRVVTSTVTVERPISPGTIKIAVVSDIGGRGDLSFNDMAFKGGDEAEKDLGVQMVELISKTEADYVPNLETAARDPDVKLIVGVGFLLSEALLEVAAKYPDKNFAGIDTFTQALAVQKTGKPLPNMLDIVYEEHKGSAMVGALGCLLAAYYNEQGGNYPYIGGVFGIEIPVLWKFEIGYKWGCDWGLKWYEQRFGRRAPLIGEDGRYGSGPNWENGLYCPQAGQCWYKGRVLWTYTGTFSDITKGYAAAKSMYEQQAIAVYNIAGPLGLGINQAVQEIATEKKLKSGPPYWIGVDANQDWINPGFVIASMMKRVDRGVYYAALLTVIGKFKEVVADTNGVLVLGIGTKVGNLSMEGISVSTLADLDEFIKMGVDAEKLTGKKVLPMSPEEIRQKVTEMRQNLPTWIWDGLTELESKIRSGQAQVPMVLTKEEVDRWRELLG